MADAPHPVPATTATTVNATTVTPAANPLLDSRNVTEVGGLVLLFAAISTGVNKWFDNRTKGREEKHAVEHDRLNDRIQEHKHDIAEARQKIVALEHFRSQDVERIVRVETAVQAITESQSRIEHSLDTMRDENKAGRGELVDAIRRLQDITNKRD